MSPRIALVAAQVRGEERWGEERFKAGVRMALEGSGMEMEVVPVEHDESSAGRHRHLRVTPRWTGRFYGVIASCTVAWSRRNKVAYLVRTARRCYDLSTGFIPANRRFVVAVTSDLDRDAPTGGRAA